MLIKKTWYADAWKEVRSYSKKINYKIVSTNITGSNGFEPSQIKMRFQILCSTESVSSYIEYITLLAITRVPRSSRVSLYH